MNQETTFTYTYSAKENQEVYNIRSKYLPVQESGVDTLKALDRKVKRPAHIFAYLFGSLSAIIMGSGMSLVMTDLAGTVGIQHPMYCGIAIGLVGMLMALVNYPMYKGILGARRRKYADKVIALSDAIMQG